MGEITNLPANHEHTLQIIDKNVNQITQLVHEKLRIWAQYELFSWRWWLGVFLTIAPWVVWYIVTRNNRSMDRFLYVGFLIIAIALGLDVLGDQYGLWHYRFNVIPLVPTYFPWDYSLMPIFVMTFLQIKPDANPFVKSIIFALITSYGGEPFFYWIDVYNPIHWKFIYSVPIQIIIFLVAYYFCKTRTKFDTYV